MKVTLEAVDGRGRAGLELGRQLAASGADAAPVTTATTDSLQSPASRRILRSHRGQSRALPLSIPQTIGEDQNEVADSRKLTSSKPRTPPCCVAAAPGTGHAAAQSGADALNAASHERSSSGDADEGVATSTAERRPRSLEFQVPAHAMSAEELESTHSPRLGVPMASVSSGAGSGSRLAHLRVGSVPDSRERSQGAARPQSHADGGASPHGLHAVTLSAGKKGASPIAHRTALTAVHPQQGVQQRCWVASASWCTSLQSPVVAHQLLGTPAARLVVLMTRPDRVRAAGLRRRARFRDTVPPCCSSLAHTRSLARARRRSARGSRTFTSRKFLSRTDSSTASQRQSWTFFCWCLRRALLVLAARERCFFAMAVDAICL